MNELLDAPAGNLMAERMANRERQRIGQEAHVRRPPLRGRVEARLWARTRQARSWGQGGAILTTTPIRYSRQAKLRYPGLRYCENIN